MGDGEWVPVSCTLPSEERPLRAAEWDGLFAGHLQQASRTGPLGLRLELDAGCEAPVRDLAEREGGCCSFFAFAVAVRPEAVLLDVSVDAAHAAVLDAVEARARAVGGPR
ncbi:hypothetical protein [Streptomyces sp. NRRL B-24484]|uniref:hypothetical protein n=1 Tax=Streptomyces sp. NRRL B-24484 TaxID=1463833 RepID=UPI0004C27D3B|nr:hypothetical protein [Streptomyces sp. NRRL B-24484]